MPSFELEESDYSGPIPDDTVCSAEVIGSKIVEKNYLDDSGQKARKLRISFSILDEGPWEGRKIHGETSTTFNTNPNCKLRNWAQEILGTELEVGYRLDTDILTNQRCRIIVGLKEYSDDQGNPREFNFVKDVMRSRVSTGADSF